MRLTHVRSWMARGSVETVWRSRWATEARAGVEVAAVVEEAAAGAHTGEGGAHQGGEGAAAGVEEGEEAGKLVL